jgi:hypothetical protein
VVVDGQAQLKPGAKVAIQVNAKKANKDPATTATAAP